MQAAISQISFNPLNQRFYPACVLTIAPREGFGVR